MSMDILKVLEVSSLHQHLDLPIPPTVVLGIGTRQLTHVRHNGVVLEFASIQLHEVEGIVNKWKPTKRYPLCILKTSQRTCLLGTAQEALVEVRKLYEEDRNFLLQKFIVTSKRGAKLIQVTLGENQPKMAEYSTILGVATNLSIARKLETLGDQQAFTLNPEWFLVNQEGPKTEGPTQILKERTFIQHCTTLKEIVSKLLLELPLALLHLNFLKDLNGNLYFLKVDKYVTSSMKVAPAIEKSYTSLFEHSRSRAMLSRTRTRVPQPRKLHYSLSNVQANFKGRLKLTREKVVTPLIDNSKVRGIKNIHYGSWIRRKKDPTITYLDKEFCKVISKVNVPSPRNIQQSLEEMIDSLTIPDNKPNFANEIGRFVLRKQLDQSVLSIPNEEQECEAPISEDHAIRSYLNECSFKLDRILDKVKRNKPETSPEQPAYSLKSLMMPKKSRIRF